MINKKKMWILSLVLFLLVIIPLVTSQNFTFNESFCENEEAGFDMMGYDFYMLCEHNFVDEYYLGYGQFVNLTGDDVNPIRKASAVPNIKPLSLEPKTLQEYFILVELETNTSKINLDRLVIINYSNPNQTAIPDLNILDDDLILDGENKTGPLVVKNSTNPRIPENTNQDDLLDLETGQSSPVDRSNLNIQNYLLYLGVGLFVLLILYIGIHILAKKHSEKQEIAVAYSYVVLLRKQNYSDQQIKRFFMQKGYEEAFINKVLKTQDSNP